MSFLSKIFGDANAKYIKSLQPVVDRISLLEPKFEKLSDEQLRAKTEEFRKLVANGQSLDTILPEAFAAVREAAKRTLNQRHFDVQLMGGIALHQGKIVEMKTGEGKTLVATLPVYLNALEGKSVHVVTVNDFLSRRDAIWMGQIYDALGISTGCINHAAGYVYDAGHTEKDKIRDEEGSFKIIHEFLRPVTRREAYAADITYGTNNEFGFDYLRDNMVYASEQMAQRGHNFVIVDEVDSILIDEARTPLIISAPDEDSTQLYNTFSRIVPGFIENEDYNLDEKLKAVSITEKGIEKVEKTLGVDNIYNEGDVRYVHHLEQALKSYVLFKKDRDYVIKGGEVIIVDEFTGRLMPGRRWSEGLHQAVEAKEGVKIQKESRTLATITFQNYFRLYKKISGMTGTARTSAEEFHKVFSLDVVEIPTNRPLVRNDMADRIYKNEEGKLKALVGEIREKHEKGQPVLVGTVSIEKNELLSAMLSREGVPHNLLNAKNHEKEAEIIAQAGKLGTVTIATNMAGRGVDIVLGGNPALSDEASKACEVGGLHVIGTERHEARRIDDQLRGRAGRQGDPGSSQFFVSTQDDVIRVFGGDRLHNIMNTLGVGDDDVIENKFISRAIEQAQSKIEGHNFDIRKYVLEYDDVMNKHREAVYKLRKEIISSSDVEDKVTDFVKEYIGNLVDFHTQGASYEWNIKEISESFKAMTGSDIHSELSDKAKANDREEVKSFIADKAVFLYEVKEKELGEEEMRKLERIVLIRTIDELWMNHIEAMEHLRDSVRLRAYGQRDPLVEYKIEGQKMFQQLMSSIGTQVANIIFKVSLMQQPQRVKAEERRPDIVQESHSHQQNINEPVHRPPTQTDESQENNKPKIGRNDPCWCGSKKKYKKCHGK